VLDRVSFRIRAGESIGITGRTGSGKTLIVNLVARLLDPDEARS
jgi:ABC-type multidrug transport system fused ATPase/permease subunit